MLTRLLGKTGGEVSIITDYHDQDTEIAALNVSKRELHAIMWTEHTV